MILLVDDRINRQIDFLQESGLEKISKYTFLRNLTAGEDIEKIKDSFTKNDYSSLKDYQTIMIHRSILISKDRMSLKDHCVKNHMDIVFFSGSITSKSISLIESSKILNISSSVFYSENLFTYLDRYKEEKSLELLAFGNSWEINILLNMNTVISGILDSREKWLDSKIPIQVLLGKIGMETRIQWLLNQSLIPFEEGNVENPRSFLQNLKEKIFKSI